MSELRKELVIRESDVDGSKEILVSRLEESDAAAAAEAAAAETDDNSDGQFSLDSD